jgi:hypothetical protein
MTFIKWIEEHWPLALIGALTLLGVILKLTDTLQ